MSSLVRHLADLELRGSLMFGKNLSTFPSNPRSGQVEMVEGVIWVYTSIEGVLTWYPLTNKKNSNVHTQAVASFQWTVSHGLGTDNVVYAVYGDDGSLIVANRTPIDDNSFRLNFTSAVTGRCVIFADAERFSSNIEAGTLSAAAINVASGVVTADQTGLKVSGQQVATLDQGTGTLNATQIPTIGWNKISGTPTTLSAYGITDAYTKTDIDLRIQGVVDAAPAALDTLKELASALGDDANFAGTITAALANKADKATTYTKTEVDGAISAYKPVATNSSLGMVKPGVNVTIAEDGTISAAAGYSDAQAQAALASALTAKADKATTYTKVEVDALLSAQATALTNAFTAAIAAAMDTVYAGG